MANKVFLKAEWYRDESHDCLWLRPHGCYEVGEEFDKTGWTAITREDLYILIDFLDSNGYLKPRLDERLRAEDLKITHRLLDIIEAKVK